jgi:hypothetical protein
LKVESKKQMNSIDQDENNECKMKKQQCGGAKSKKLPTLDQQKKLFHI